jgi:uncharacterized protein YoaH (UPF0181 family)
MSLTVKGFEIPVNFVDQYHNLVATGLSDDECINIIAWDINHYHEQNERGFDLARVLRESYLEAKEAKEIREVREVREAKEVSGSVTLDETLMLIKAVEEAEKAEVLKAVEMAERYPEPSAPPRPVCEGEYAKCAL